MDNKKPIYGNMLFTLEGNVTFVVTHFVINDYKNVNLSNNGEITSIKTSEEYEIKTNRNGINLSYDVGEYDARDIDFLPYEADLTQDIPGYFKFKPKIYKNCRLLSYKQNGYLCFVHPPTCKILKIAINNFTYKKSGQNIYSK